MSKAASILARSRRRQGAPVLLHRPILGGVFGAGTYALASLTGKANGLHALRYLVLNPRTGVIVAAAGDKRDALAAARRVIEAGDLMRRYGEAANDPHPTQEQLWPDLAPAPALAPPDRKVSRRRRQVFERSDGRCCYCGAAITLETFEVEHQLPRALGGGDESVNLAAACRACNRAKADRSAVEFVVQQAIDSLE